MVFTTVVSDASEKKCYYLRAFHEDIFRQLSLKEREQLILFTANLLDHEVNVTFGECPDGQMAIFDNANGLFIDPQQLMQNDPEISLQLYVYLRSRLSQKKPERQRYKIKSKKKVLEESRRRRKKAKQRPNHDLEIIVLHLILDDLLKLRKFYVEENLSLLGIDRQLMLLKLTYPALREKINEQQALPDGRISEKFLLSEAEERGRGR
ncbi:MAG: hypothetical protein E7680_05420 [Ruminococcaceae bacterium]|nr:hypothetical protein [Oscillospiraceae bacterium]